MRLVGVLLLGACYAPQPHPGSPCPDGNCPSDLICSPATRTCEVSSTDPTGDANGSGDSGDGNDCFGNGLVKLCPGAPITGAVTLTGAINTDTSPLCIAFAQTNACVIAGATVNLPIGTTVTATGSRPLVILATQSLAIEGTLDVASHRQGQLGAGANDAACIAGQAATNKYGGPGGSFGGRGGAGGGGPLAAAATTSITTLRGGCAGLQGAGGTQGAGGSGGGAVYLIAASSLAITGTINASGAGGGGAIDTAGGGGGGSGGMIGLDAPSITIASSALIFANGGGGGEGAGNSNSGLAGADPTTALTPAAGGAGGAGAGDGGNGAAGVITSGGNGTVSDEGGGGGGGAGVIKVFPAQSVSGAVSPTPS